MKYRVTIAFIRTAEVYIESNDGEVAAVALALDGYGTNDPNSVIEYDSEVILVEPANG